MTYNFKHIRLFENSPFKKISKSEKPADDLSAVRKVSANIIKENLSEKLYYILHLFYYHLLLINRDEKMKSITSLTGEKLLITAPTEELDERQTDWFKLFCLKPSIDYNFRNLEYVKNNVIIRTTENGLYIKLPCIFDRYYRLNIAIVNPRNTMTIKDVYVNQLKYILQYGYKDKNVQKYYKHLLNNIRNLFDEEKSIDINEIFNDIHEYLKFCSDNIDIKYVITDNNYNNHLNLILIDIQSMDDVNESFLSIFENNSFVIDDMDGIIMINSFVMSTDYSEVKKLLRQMSTSGTCTYLSSLVDNDTKHLLKNIYNISDYKVSAGLCENMTLYDHCELNDLSIISKCIESRVVISVGNPKNCSFRTDILNSILNTTLYVSSHLKFLKNGGTISKFDILKAVTDNNRSYYINSNTKKKNDKVLSSERVKNNTNNDEYSKFIKSFEINKFPRFKDILCDVVAAGA